ncbi:uncharacterized protein BP5553_01625 [Venustampulla echinocandica]|uniref:F-box domain-containing protein n=1 Tax=Venustampulla echinocandica TaxID=2656787 RepID=A0A370U1I9_9HELO|nr:uncharacterized protein BP5553_01625 [Venustampulla echinocandica]RDL41646.1 hypothetical protein BP5553_01625 [Venustampulla echinocandica]
MAHRYQFDQFPVEVIRRIAASGPCSSAISLLLTSRKLYSACSDWTVFQSLIESNSNGGRQWNLGMSMFRPDKVVWARYAFADMRAAQFMTYATDSSPENASKWAPMLMTLHHPLLEFEHIKQLSMGLRSSQPQDILLLQFCITACSMSHRTFQPGFDSDEERTLLYASLLGHDLEGKDPLDLPRVLSNLQYFPSIPTNGWPRTHNPATPLSQLLLLAYKALPLIYYNLMIAITHNKVYVLKPPTHTPNPPPQPPAPPNHLPPTAIHIPFTSFMNIPLPFSLKCEEDFTTAHLPAMTHPSFISDGTWKGYTLTTWDEGPEVGRFDIPISNVKFHTRTSPNDSNILEIWCEKLHSEMMGRYRFRGTVERDTGKMELVKCYDPAYIDLPHQAVMTPFGIIGTWGERNAGNWLWLWKSGWCDSEE